MSTIDRTFRLWVPFTLAEAEAFILAEAEKYPSQVALLKSKIANHEAFENWPVKDGRMARALRRDEMNRGLDAIELEIEI